MTITGEEVKRAMKVARTPLVKSGPVEIKFFLDEWTFEVYYEGERKYGFKQIGSAVNYFNTFVKKYTASGEAA